MSIRRVTIPEDCYDREQLEWLRQHDYAAYLRMRDSIIEAYLCRDY
jgi:hypothetical protein